MDTHRTKREGRALDLDGSTNTTTAAPSFPFYSLLRPPAPSLPHQGGLSYAEKRDLLCSRQLWVELSSCARLSTNPRSACYRFLISILTPPMCVAVTQFETRSCACVRASMGRREKDDHAPRVAFRFFQSRRFYSWNWLELQNSPHILHRISC